VYQENVRFVGFDDPISGKPYGIRGNVLKWRGHFGVGDFLYGLNIAYYTAHILNTKIIFQIHWDHDRSYYFAHDDIETIFERFEYLHNFYYRKDELVEVEHVYNYPDIDKDFKGELGLNYSRYYPLWPVPEQKGRSNHVMVFSGLNNWKFNNSVDTTPIKDKVVIWKPFLNATTAPKWKLTYNPLDWEWIENALERLDYKVFEIDYRTPVSEAFYHIRTCDFVVAYDGMWQYISKNMYKPIIVLGDNNIIRTHNGQGVFFQEKNKDLRSRDAKYRNVLEYISKLRESTYDDLIQTCEAYKQKVLPHIERFYEN